jgi:DEAD/DEAH box helicase domain-containing protein
MRNVAAWRRMPARAAVYAPFPTCLDPRLIAALASRGMAQLYRHQAAAVEAALRGEHVAVVTPAASGKTLCYNLPVLHRLLADPAARALYLFPTKALAQDQLAALADLSGVLALGGPPATYDGDTSSGQRTKIRDNARVILSNPDMLHMGILPQHTRWAGFFANLRVIVIDEMHAYRGVFGSHVANVLRRLRRICRFYGNEPQFIFASATIANPGELAERLAEAPVTVIGPEQNGAPQGERNIILYNPPIVDASLGIRRSAAQEAAAWAAYFVSRDVQTIVFAGSRLTTELLLLDWREQLRGPDGVHAVAANALRGYRGGYLPNERREIERGLRNGSLRGVAATNALELGIDIGQLGAALLAGYPGTIASAWQEMGRAGRRQEAAAALLIASANPLDQYIIAHPDYLLGSSPERGLINPDNPMILADHLACAAAELPFDHQEGFGRLAGAQIADLLAYLAQSGELYEAGERYFWGGEGYPSANVSLRTSSPDRVVIQAEDDADKPVIIGELDRFSVPLLVYEGAIYIHGGETYLVDRLDWEEGIAHVRRTAVDYYTRPSIGEEVEVLAEREGRDETVADDATPQPDRVAPQTEGATAAPSFHVAWGDVRVVSKASGFRILKRSTHEMLGYGTIELPEQVLETTACWLAFSTELVAQLKAAGEWFSDPNEYGPTWPAQRAAARARDGYRCQGCGIPEREGKQHDVHHKIPFRAFVADARLRGGLPVAQAAQVANQLDNLVTLCSSCHKRAEQSVRTRSGLGGAAWALAGVAPLYLMCDPRDLGMVVEPQSPATRLPTITLYEKVPAGIGYAAELYRLMPDLLRAAYDLVAACPCERGCPACVGPVLDHDYALDTKALSTALLKAVC